MVNIAKRMRALKPILYIRNGQGAAILPPSPAPQLVNLHLRFPLGPYNDVVNGPRYFWRRHLRRLKYYNPALSITVQHERGDEHSPMLLTLQFEHEDPEVLQAIPGSVGRPIIESHAEAFKKYKKRKEKKEVMEELTDEEKEMLARQQSPNFRDAPTREAAPIPQEPEPASEQEAPSEEPAEAPKPENSTPPLDGEAPSDAVQRKETGGSGTPMYTRIISMAIRKRTEAAIWQFVKERTNAKDVPISADDVRERQQLKQFEANAALDRERVKAGVDAMRKEKADLQKARGEAERMKAEAV